MKRRQSGGLFDVYGNPVPNNRKMIDLTQQTSFFTTRDKAARYRATTPNWRQYEEAAAKANLYRSGKLEFEDAYEVLLTVFTQMYEKRESSDIQKLLSVITKQSGVAALELFMEECTKRGMRVEYTPVDDTREDPNSARLTINTEPDQQSNDVAPFPILPQPEIIVVKGRLVDFITSHSEEMKEASLNNNGAAVDNIITILSNCPRYVINKRVTFLCSDVAKHGKLQRTRSPSGLLWVETEPMDGAILGFAWVGDGDYDSVEEGVWEANLQHGRLVIFMRSITGTISYSVELTLGEDPIFGGEYARVEQRWPEGKRAMMRRQTIDQCKLFAAFCMLMSAPKTHTVEHINFDKLNRQRVKVNKPPLNDYTSVKLSVDGPIGRAGRRLSGPGDSTAEKVGKRLHFVGHFWRTRLGKLEFVRPHWRGDATLGRVEGRNVR